MKTNKQLLTILLDTVKIQEEISGGLCNECDFLYFENVISQTESRELKWMIYLNKPEPSGDYYWRRGLVKPRVKFLKELIEIYSKDQSWWGKLKDYYYGN